MSSSVQFNSEHVCYVNCNYCNTILVVNVPNNCSYNIVTVRCGHCTMVLSMDLGPFHQARTAQENLVPNRGVPANNCGSYEPGSRNQRTMAMYPMLNNQQQVSPIRPPEKRQRVPSAYNRFIKEEIQRLKSSNPEISHREAFSAAAKNVVLRTSHWLRMWSLLLRTEAQECMDFGCNHLETVARELFSRFGWRTGLRLEGF